MVHYSRKTWNFRGRGEVASPVFRVVLLWNKVVSFLEPTQTHGQIGAWQSHRSLVWSRAPAVVVQGWDARVESFQRLWHEASGTSDTPEAGRSNNNDPHRQRSARPPPPWAPPRRPAGGVGFSLAIGLSSSITPMICDSSASMVGFVVLPAAFVPRRRRVALGSATGVLFPAINHHESGTPKKKQGSDE